MTDDEFILYVTDCSSRIESALKENYPVQGLGLGQYVKSVEHILPESLYNKIFKKIVPMRNKIVHTTRDKGVCQVTQIERFQFKKNCEYCMKELEINFDENYFTNQTNKNDFNYEQEEQDAYQNKPFHEQSYKKQYQVSRYNKQRYFSYYDGQKDQITKEEKEALLKSINNRMAFGIPGLIKRVIKKIPRLKTQIENCKKKNLE